MSRFVASRRAVLGASIAVVAVAAGGIAVGTLAFAGTSSHARHGSAAGSSGAVRYVSTSGVDGTSTCTHPRTPCATVQHAVDVAADGDTVSIAKGDYAQNVVLAGKSLTLTAADPWTAVLSGHSIDGVTLTVRGTAAVPAPKVTLHGLVLAHNSANPGLEVDAGIVRATSSALNDDVDYGAVVYAPGSLSLTDAIVDGNNGAGVAVLGGTLTLHDATVSGNVADDRDENPARGGVTLQGGRVVVVNSTFGNNGGAGLAVGAGGNVTGAATVTASTFDGNRGAGIYVADAALSLTGSTVAGTRASVGAADGIPTAAGVTVTGASTVRVAASIIAEQHGVPDCSGTITDTGYNLSGDPSDTCRFTAAHHSLAHAAAHLGSLAHHSGITWTRLPGTGSAAVARIPLGRADCRVGMLDQRGVARVQSGAHSCDIGAAQTA